jgi:hypothetical protein
MAPIIKHFLLTRQRIKHFMVVIEFILADSDPFSNAFLHNLVKPDGQFLTHLRFSETNKDEATQLIGELLSINGIQTIK